MAVRGLFLLLLLAGCARDSLALLDAKLGALVGRPVTELSARMGNPRVLEQREIAGGETVLLYRYLWPEGEDRLMRFDSSEARNRVCDIVFTSRNGRVTGYRYAGEACGWGGLPDVLP